MKYGLIGEKLGHSYSAEIHGLIADYEYTLCEVAKEDFDLFMKKRDFKGINVTIPYKQEVIPYLDEIDERARDIGAVNVVVNREGKLYGYNTDFFGLRELILRLRVSLLGKRVAILGTGGTSHTATAVAKDMGVSEVVCVSRGEKEGSITYEELYRRSDEIDFIINTTPKGMYPDVFGTAVDLSRFPSLLGLVDVVYNPLHTALTLEARGKNIPSESGLYMLVAQAIKASELFLGTSYPIDTIPKIYDKMLGRKENIVLIGMPASGKSTVGRLISEKLSRKFVDTDELIEERAGMTISEIFSRYGEKYFRGLESEIISEVARTSSLVVATGGGAILREENLEALRLNGRLFFIDRPLDKLIPTDTRPLSSDREAIEKRYNERYEIYCSVCDVHIDADTTPENVAEKIINS